MRKKLKYKFIFLLVIVLIFSVLFTTSCEIIAEIIGGLKREVDDEIEAEGQKEIEQYNKEVAEKHRFDAKYKPLVHYDYLFLFPDVTG